jgi:hypothetical protein
LPHEDLIEEATDIAAVLFNIGSDSDNDYQMTAELIELKRRLWSLLSPPA